MPWITLHYSRIMDTIEAGMNEMADQLARLKADNDTKSAEIQNLKVAVQEKVEVAGTSAAAVRQQRIQQVKGQFSNPAEKRAMGFLTVLSIDTKEMASKLGRVLEATPGYSTGDYSLHTVADEARMCRAAADFVGFLTIHQRNLKDRRRHTALPTRVSWGGQQ